MTQAVWVQEDFRFVDDDGNLATATLLGASNNDNPPGFSTGASNKFRARLVVQQTAGGKSVNNQLFEFWYSHNGGGYTQLTTISSVINIADDDNSLVHNATTAQRIGDGTYTTGDSQGYVDAGASTGQVDFSGSDEFEAEFCCFLITADVAHNDTIDIRTRLSGGTTFNTYSNTPQISASKDTPPAGANESFAPLIPVYRNRRINTHKVR